MEDMASKLSALLSSPEGMQTLMNMASALGLGATPESPGASQPPPYAPPWNAARQGMGHNTPPRPGQQPPQQPPGPPPPQPPPPGQQAQPDLNGIASMLGGSVIIETVFSLPGLGSLIMSSILARDYPAVQGCVILFAVIIMAVNLLTDILYSVLDPRVKLQ